MHYDFCILWLLCANLMLMSCRLQVFWHDSLSTSEKNPSFKILGSNSTLASAICLFSSVKEVAL